MNEINYDANSVLLFSSHTKMNSTFVFFFSFSSTSITAIYCYLRYLDSLPTHSLARRHTQNAIAIHRSSQIIMRFYVHFVSITHRAQYSFQTIVYFVVVLNYAVTFDCSASRILTWTEYGPTPFDCGDGDAHKNRFHHAHKTWHIYTIGIYNNIHVYIWVYSKSKYRTIALTVALSAVQTIEIQFRTCASVCMRVTESIEHMGASCDDSFDSHITIHSKATSFCVLLYVVCISFAVHAPLTHILKHTKPSFTLFYFPLIPFTHSLEPCARARVC